jgi:hypothetical protein
MRAPAIDGVKVLNTARQWLRAMPGERSAYLAKECDGLLLQLLRVSDVAVYDAVKSQA